MVQGDWWAQKMSANLRSRSSFFGCAPARAHEMRRSLKLCFSLTYVHGKGEKRSNLNASIIFNFVSPFLNFLISLKFFLNNYVMLQITSWGGTSKVSVRISTFWYESTQGTTKNTPGPRAPPERRRPNRKITTLSYSWTTLTAKHKEKGMVTNTSRMDRKVIRWAHRPGPSSQAVRQSAGTPIIFLWVKKRVEFWAI